MAGESGAGAGEHSRGHIRSGELSRTVPVISGNGMDMLHFVLTARMGAWDMPFACIADWYLPDERLCVRFEGVGWIQIRCAPGIPPRFRLAKRNLAPGPGIDTLVLLTAAEIVAAALDELPTDVRSVVEAHFVDGESATKIQRHRKMKRKDVEAIIKAALEDMRAALEGWGIHGISDLI